MQKVRAGDVEIAYREAGSGDPVFLINGTGESGATWALQTRALSQNWRCVAIDNRDTGDSTYVEADYTPKDMADDAAAVIDELKLGPCHIVGYSLGGAVAQELALNYRERVRSLVLIATWARSDAWFVAQMRNWQMIRRAHWDDEEGFERALAPWLFSPRTFEQPDLVERLYHHVEETKQRPDGWIRQTEADIAHDAGERLRDVSAPALVLVGSDDICTPLRYSRELCSLLPSTELFVVDGAAHALVGERPNEVNGAIGGFLSRHFLSRQ